MSILINITELLVDILTFPTAILFDIFTVGGMIIGRDRTFTVDHVEFIKNDIEAIKNKIKK